MPRRPRPSTTGVIVVDKPLHFSSMDVVRVVRGKARGAKTGHAGTLDPLATGVLIVCLGKATKLVNRLMDTPKHYCAEVDLSAFTVTDDREGDREEVPVPEPPSSQVVAAAARRFVGEIEQKPPAYSAINVAGRRAYRLARQGEEVELAARPIVIHSIDVLRYDWPILRLDIGCGKGTYIRSLARDLGVALGTGGHLASLVRTQVGPFSLESSRRLDDLPEPLLEEHLLSLDAVGRLLAASA